MRTASGRGALSTRHLVLNWVGRARGTTTALPDPLSRRDRCVLPLPPALRPGRLTSRLCCRLRRSGWCCDCYVRVRLAETCSHTWRAAQLATCCDRGFEPCLRAAAAGGSPRRPSRTRSTPVNGRVDTSRVRGRAASRPRRAADEGGADCGMGSDRGRSSRGSRVGFSRRKGPAVRRTWLAARHDVDGVGFALVDRSVCKSVRFVKSLSCGSDRFVRARPESNAFLTCRGFGDLNSVI